MIGEKAALLSELLCPFEDGGGWGGGQPAPYPPAPALFHCCSVRVTFSVLGEKGAMAAGVPGALLALGASGIFHKVSLSPP